MASGQAFATAITSAGTGNWNTAATWTPVQVPTNLDTVTIAAGHTVTVNVDAVAQGLTVMPGSPGGTLTFASNTPPYTLDVGANGISNQGTFNATNAGAITSAATAAGIHGVYNNRTFIMGSGTLNTSGTQGIGLENEIGGTFTGGSGLITVTNGFRNGLSGAATFTVGSGGITLAGTVNGYSPINGTLVLNGNMTIGGNIYTGTATASGAGKMILTDAAHAITGAVNVHNLETATFTGWRTITINGAVTATGTTKLNGVSGSLIVFAGASTPTFTAFNSYYCSAAGGVTGITCNAGAPPPPISASINLMSNEKPMIFAEEIEMK